MWRRDRADEDFSEEVQAHIEFEVDRLVAEGSSAADARAAAYRRFGSVALVKEQAFEMNRWMWLEHALQDLRYAARVLRQHPPFLATTVTTLAVALGLVTAAFTLFNAYVLRPYAVRDPKGLYEIGWRTQDRAPGVTFRWRDYEELRERRDIFTDVVAEGVRPVSSNGRTLAAALVSDNYFEALAPQMQLGRPLAAGDGPYAEAVVLSHRTWKGLYDDIEVIGQQIDLNGRRFLVVGVMGPEFTGLGESSCDLWFLFTTYAAIVRPTLVGDDQPASVAVSARLQPGVSADQARGALAEFMTRVVGSGASGIRVELTPHASPAPFTLELLGAFSIVFSPFILVLVTACANLSNVMFARAIARQREIAVRLSLGATRGRIVRQLLTEGLLIAMLAGLAGIVLASWALQGSIALLMHTLPPPVASMTRVVPMSLDHRVFAFAMTAAALATLTFALLPAVQASRLPLTEAIRGHGSGPLRRSTLRSALIVGQVAVSVVLVVLAITLARNGLSLGRTDLGYRTEGVVSINLRDPDDALLQRLANVLEADPRVARVAITSGNPLFVIDLVAGRGDTTRTVLANAGEGTVAVRTRYTFVSPQYFDLLQLPIVRGRGFEPDEGRSAARVAIVSASTARAFWPGEDPVGKIVSIERPNGRAVDDLTVYSHATVIGVAADHISGMVIEGPDRGHIYLPISSAHPRAFALLARERPGSPLTPAALQQIFGSVSIDPQVFEALRLDDMRALQAYPLQAAAWAGSFLGLLAIGLSISGLYGVLIYALSQRTREIGIRMALGASAGAVVRLVMGQSARLSGVGAAIGWIVAFGAMKALSAYVRLHEVAWLDGAAFVGGLLVVGAAAVIAAYQPARRATRVDPTEALRADV